MTRLRGGSLAIALAAGGVAVLLAANAHLIYVAVTSQPDCVEHIREAGSGPPGARYAPAKSSC